MRAKAGAAACIALLLLGVLPTPAGAEKFGALEVTAPDWQLLSLPYNLSAARTLFQTPGDVNGDGFDDILVWRGPNEAERGFVLINGSAEGLDLEHARAVNGGPFGSLSDTGWPMSFDQRPSGIDANGDGLADVAGYYHEGNACAEWPIGAEPVDCVPVESSDLRVVLGNVSKPLRSSETMINGVAFGGTAPAMHLTGPVGPGSTAAFVVETVHPRSADNTTGAWTIFDVYEYPENADIRKAYSWNASEPKPLEQVPRPPRFIAAPDFDGDGFADIVTWSPPGQGSSGSQTGLLAIYNGSAPGLQIAAPLSIEINASAVLIGDFDGNGRPDIAFYRIFGAGAAGSTTPHIDLTLGYSQSDGIHSFNWDSIRLEGPSIFLSAPPVRLQAGDIDGDGRADLAALKYDTTSAQAGHLLADVFLGVPTCPICDRATSPTMNPRFSSEIQLTGRDIYANEGGLRVNLQADYDGDGLRDLAVGFYGGNSPRAPTNQSGLVAVLPGRTIVAKATGLTMEPDAGGFAYPLARAYRLRLTVPVANSGTLRFEFTNVTTSIFFDVDLATDEIRSPYNGTTPFLGEIQTYTEVLNCQPCGELIAPVALYWNFTETVGFGAKVSYTPADGGPSEVVAANPHLANFERRVHLDGALRNEWRGQEVLPGAWVAGNALVNVSGLRLAFVGPGSISVPRQTFTWVLKADGVQVATAPGDPFVASLVAPNYTARNSPYRVEVQGLPSIIAAPSLDFTMNTDASGPSFGDHLPLETEWAASHPVYVAAQIFDNESGVDPSRIEYAWQNDSSLYSAWSKASWMPGQTAAEVVAHALIYFPEGNLSNIIWRAWDKAGNGPVESPTWGVKVDTQDISFHDPAPDATAWQTKTPVSISVEVRAGASGVNHGSVQFRLSNSGLFGFGPWRSDCGYPHELDPPGLTTACAVVVGPTGFRPLHFANLTEGDQNWVQWRAARNVSNDSDMSLFRKLSDPYQIRMDSKAPIIVTITPDDRNILPGGSTALQVEAYEGSPQAVAQSGLNMSLGAATYRIQPPGAADLGPPVNLDVSNLSADHWRATFSGRLYLEPGNSTLEVSIADAAGLVSTAAIQLRVNQPPTVTVTSDPPSLTVLVNGTITFTAIVADPDSSSFTYFWGAVDPFLGCFRGSTLPIPPVPLSRRPTATLSPSSPECLRTTQVGDLFLVLTVRDDMGGQVTIRFAVHIVETLPPNAPPPGGTGNESAALLPSVNFALGIALLLAAIAAAFVVFYLRRRLPPDNL